MSDEYLSRDIGHNPYTCQKHCNNCRNSKYHNLHWFHELLSCVFHTPYEARDSDYEEGITRSCYHRNTKEIDQNGDSEYTPSSTDKSQCDTDQNRCYVAEDFHNYVYIFLLDKPCAVSHEVASDDLYTPPQ